MELYSFFDAELIDGEYDRLYNAEDWARYFRSFIGNGVFANPSSNLQVISETNDMNIVIKQGKAWIDGYFYENSDDLPLAVDVADGVLNRIDRVVVKLDFTNREIKIYIKKGELASTPQAPSLQRDFDVYELSLATISIAKGVTRILQADITDTRADTSLCGIVTGLVKQIDTTDLFAQYDSAFNLWFETVQGSLSGDVAGNLQNQINDLSNKFFDKTDTGEQQIDGNLMLLNNKGIGSYTTGGILSWLLYLGQDNKTWLGSQKAPLVLSSSVTPQAFVNNTSYDLYHSGSTTIQSSILKATTDIICERYGNVGYFTHAQDSVLGTGLFISNSNGGKLHLTNTDWLVYESKDKVKKTQRVVVQLNESLGLDGNYRIWWGAEGNRPHTGIQFCF